MHARMNVFKGSAESVEAGLEDLRTSTIPALREIPGSRGLVALMDRETGKSIGITLWESEEAMRASEEAAEDLRTEVADRSGDQLEAVERYEVAFLEVRA